jgi:hypothetical protein
LNAQKYWKGKKIFYYKFPILAIISLNSALPVNSTLTYKKTPVTSAIVLLLGLGLLASLVGQALAVTTVENTARTQGELIPSLAQNQRIPGSLSEIANDHGAEVSAIAHR